MYYIAVPAFLQYITIMPKRKTVDEANDRAAERSRLGISRELQRTRTDFLPEVEHSRNFVYNWTRWQFIPYFPQCLFLLELKLFLKT